MCERLDPIRFVELRPVRGDVPVVLVSGFSEEHLKERVEDPGFAGCLKKPVRRGALLKNVRETVACRSAREKI